MLDRFARLVVACCLPVVIHGGDRCPIRVPQPRPATQRIVVKLGPPDRFAVEMGSALAGDVPARVIVGVDDDLPVWSLRGGAPRTVQAVEVAHKEVSVGRVVAARGRHPLTLNGTEVEVRCGRPAAVGAIHALDPAKGVVAAGRRLIVWVDLARGNAADRVPRAPLHMPERVRHAHRVELVRRVVSGGRRVANLVRHRHNVASSVVRGRRCRSDPATLFEQVVEVLGHRALDRCDRVGRASIVAGLRLGQDRSRVADAGADAREASESD